MATGCHATAPAGPQRAAGFGALPGLVVACTGLFAVSAAATIVGCASMSTMGGMSMPGGWTMSMAWMRMPGQSWAGAAAAFVAMWCVMMVAMMLPSLAPVLWRHRQALQAADRAGLLTLRVALAYFAVWAGVGAAVYAVGMPLAALAMRSPAVARAAPAAAGAVLLLAGLLQFSRWKARHLGCCRDALRDAGAAAADRASAWRLGLRHGLHCAHCCAGPTAVLLVLGVMDLGAMALVTAAISAERLAPGGTRVARSIGVAIAAAGVLLIARAAAG